MTSTIKVDNIQNQCGANIINESSNTITIGASGDTVTLASGASQSGFGRAGSVNWQTSIKTSGFTAVSGEGYFINTTSGAVTMTLPASPSVGDIVAFKDYAGTFDTNNLTIDRNGSNIVGGTNNPVISVEGQAGTLVYGDATKGWQIVESATDADLPRPTFVAATGGTITCCGNFKIHTFTGPGTFTVTCAGNPLGSNTVDYLVVAGGASGGNGSSAGGYGAGGGGAGGYRESSGAASGCYSRSPLGACVSALPVSAQGYPIAVGAGGTASAPDNSQGNNGANSSFSTITSAGGGAGGGVYTGAQKQGSAGGSGGGGGSGGATSPATPTNGGAGNTPPVSPPQGSNGGTGSQPAGDPGAGGGGATAVGQNAPTDGSGQGGAGGTSSINATPTARSGGGGGGGLGRAGAAGGSGGGGAGGPNDGPGGNGVAGTTNTGGGGGGATGGTGKKGGAGGSGIVIIRYKFQ